MLNEILENMVISSLAGNFSRSPKQINKLQETDAELIRLAPGSETLLAVTTDSLAEEISSGLYEDPYLIGWMIVMVNMSDLAAVGASPLGILVSEVLPTGMPDGACQELQRGINDASALCGTYVLGGDTNFGRELLMTGCSLGILEKGHHNSRVGCQPGDVLYTTGKLGRGNAFALSRFVCRNGDSLTYKPAARTVEGRSLLGVASACMDTSDGVLATLDQLMRLNGVGFHIDPDWENVLDADSRKLANALGIPPWLLLAGHHGEFELLFTVPECLCETLSEVARCENWSPIRLGLVTGECAIRLPLYGRNHDLDTAEIRNLASQLNLDVESYMASLLRIDERMRGS